MLSKRGVLFVLGVLNAILVIALLVASQPSSSVFAQSSGRPGDFVAVTAKVASQTYEVLYVLDVPGRKLHALYPASTGAQRNQRVPAPPRDLAKDFSRK